MNSMSSLEAAAEAAAKVNAMLIAKGKLKPPPSAVNKCKGSNVKSAGDLFTSEVEINDAPLSARNLLTRGHTQDEINKYSGAAVSTRGRYMTFEEKAKNPGERPLYLYVQASEKHAVDLGVHRIQEIIQQHMQNEQPQVQQHQPQVQQQTQPQPPPQQQQQQQQQVPQTPRRNSKFHKFVPRSANGVQQGSRPPPLMSIQTSMPSVEKVFVGLEHAGPAFDLRNKVVGSGGTNLLYIRNETGAIVTLRGKGSGYIEPSTGAESPEAMYLCIEHPKFEGLQSAKQLAQNLVETLQQEYVQWQQQQQQQQQMSTLTMQSSVLHPTQFQAMGVGMGQPGLVTVHQQLQQQDLLQSGIPGMVATSVALPVVSSIPTILAGQLQQAPQLANLHQQQPAQQHHQQHQMGTLPPHIQTGHPPPSHPPHALIPQQHQHHQQTQAIGLQPQQHHHLQMQHQQAAVGVPPQGVSAFPPQLHQAIISPLQAIPQAAPQQQAPGQPLPPPQHHPPPPAPPHGVMAQHQMSSISQQTVQGTLLVSPGQMVFTQAPVSSPQHQSPQPPQQQHHHHQHQQAQAAQQQHIPNPQGQLVQQQSLAQTPPPPPLPPPPTSQPQHLPTFQQMYMPQQQPLQQQPQGGTAAAMGMPPMHATMMHPPPMGLPSAHPQPVPLPGQPQQQAVPQVQHTLMGLPSSQTLQPSSTIPVGAYPYQQFTPAGSAATGMSGSAQGGLLPAISYPIFRQEQRPPAATSSEQPNTSSGAGQHQQLIGGKAGGHKRRFTEDSSHTDDGFQGGMPVMSAMGQPPPPPPAHSPNHHQPPPRQGNGLQEMMVGAGGPSAIAPPSLQQHGSSHQQHQMHQQQPQHHHHHHQQQHQPQQDRDKQLMPPPPPPLPAGDKRTAIAGEPEVKRHKGALSSVSGYGSDEEDQGGGADEQRVVQVQGNGPSFPSAPAAVAGVSSGTFSSPPKTTFSHYSSKPQMYGHQQGVQTSQAPSAQAQSPPSTSTAFQGLPCPQQPPPPLQHHHHHHHQMASATATMFNSGGVAQMPGTLASVPQQQQPPPPPSYAAAPSQMGSAQGGVGASTAFASYQYNSSSLPFWMVQ